MKKIACILLITACFIAKAVSQNVAKIPGFKEELKNATTDSDKVHALVNLCFHYSNVSMDTAIMYGMQGMELAKKIDYPRGLGDAYNNLGWCYYRQSAYAKAEEYFKTSMDIFMKTGIKKYIKVPLSNLATMYMDKTEYSKSLNCFMQVLKYEDEMGDENEKDVQSNKSATLHDIGRLYNMMQKPSEAKKYFQQALELSKLANNEALIGENLMSLANVLQSEGRDDEALQYYSQCLSIFKKQNDLLRTGVAYENTAGSYLNKKNYSLALKNYGEAKKYYEKLQSKSDMYYATLGLGKVYQLTGEYKSAEANINEALQYALNLKDKKMEQDARSELSRVLENTGDYRNAYLNLIESNAIKDSLFTKDSQDELLKLQTKFETERKERENQLLKAKNLAAALQLQRNRGLLIAAVIFIFLLGTILYAVYRNRQAKIKNIAVLKNLNAQLLEQKEEIGRINTILELKALRAQMNPHFIFNCMSSIQECMLTGRIEDANVYLTKLSRLLRMVLHYSDDETISLDKELNMLEIYLQLEKVRLKNNFEYTLDIDEDIATEELQVPTLILQPFAENAIWHGLVNKPGNRRLLIRAEIKDEMLHFFINDNGIGRKQAEQLKPDAVRHPSKGIELIQKRLDIIKNKTNNPNTRFLIHDLYNNGVPTGTCVEINLPLEAI